MNKLILVLSVLLCACAQQIALHGLPEIDEGMQSGWVYRCDERIVKVEYAKRQGRYSASIATDDGVKVLDVISQGPKVLASLPPLTWVSQNGDYFVLRDGNQNIATHCRATHQIEKGHIQLNMGIF